MFENTRAFSGFSVDDVARAKRFYGDTLGLRVSEANGLLTLHIAGDRDTLVYPKGKDHTPATSCPSSNSDLTASRELLLFALRYL